MGRRLVVPRIEGSAAPTEGTPKLVDPPTVAAIRMVYGVGQGSAAPPDDDTFKPTYQVSLPLFSMGGLDPDGVYEFDAGLLLDTIRHRSQRRQWGLRLEIEITQTPEAVSTADIWVEAPFADDDSLGLHVLGRTGRGTILDGGGRSIVLATTVIHDGKRAGALSGAYTFQHRDTDPASDDKASITSAIRSVRLDLTRFEFEG